MQGTQQKSGLHVSMLACILQDKTYAWYGSVCVLVGFQAGALAEESRCGWGVCLWQFWFTLLFRMLYRHANLAWAWPNVGSSRKHPRQRNPLCWVLLHGKLFACSFGGNFCWPFRLEIFLQLMKPSLLTIINKNVQFPKQIGSWLTLCMNVFVISFNIEHQK